MNKDNIYFKNILIFSSSLIVVEFYYFVNVSKAFLDRVYFVANISSLFLFTLILFILLKLLFYKMKLSNKISIYLEIFFLTFIYYKLIQIPFFLANIISLKEIIVIVFQKVLPSKYFLLIPILKLFTLFVLVLTVIFISYKKGRRFLINFVISSSLIFFSIILINLLIEKPRNIKTITLQKNDFLLNKRQVVWVLFDEYDPSYINNKEINLKLPTIQKLLKTSFVHNQSYSPSNSTDISMVSIFMNIMPIEFEYKTEGNIRITVTDKDNNKKNFNFENTFLKNLENDGFNFKLVSEVYPYCYLLGLRQNCEKDYSNFTNFFDAIKFIFFPIHYLESFIELIKIRNQFDIEKLNNLQKDSAQIIFSKYLNYSKKDFEQDLDMDTNFIFFHLFLPHVARGEKFSSIMFTHIRDFFELNVKNNNEEYLLNLRYADFIVKEILKKVESVDNKETMLILSSDHWRRNVSREDPKPSLFLAKINSDNEKFQYDEKNMNIFIPEIISLFLKEKINTHEDIYKFMNNEKKIEITDIYIKKD